MADSAVRRRQTVDGGLGAVDASTFVAMKNALPSELFVRREGRFLLSVARAVAIVIVTAWLWNKFVPLTALALPLWIIYALVNGTFAIGIWVLAHECGHGSMSDRKWLNDLVGYPLHTFLLVPYFSWQYSHSVHHSRTNHVTEGESHVPVRAGTEVEKTYKKLLDTFGDSLLGLGTLIFILVVGWPLYLLRGASGGPLRGVTNHFVPSENNKLFPKKWWLKVWMSTVGIVAMFVLLTKLSFSHGLVWVMAIYGGPVLVTNAWLVLYTYLHHTDENTPHYDEKAWNWTKGALCTIERNYPEFINWLHFDIGSSHVVHHLFPAMPHYNARQARRILETKFKELYRVDHTPIWSAMYKTAKTCVIVHENPQQAGEWRFVASTAASS